MPTQAIGLQLDYPNPSCPSTLNRAVDGTKRRTGLTTLLSRSPHVSVQVPALERGFLPSPDPRASRPKEVVATHLGSHGWNYVLLSQCWRLFMQRLATLVAALFISYFWALCLKTHRLEYILGVGALQLCYTLFFFTRLTFNFPPTSCSTSYR